ncbi:MAG: 1-acyl-sn-glycerol-3-phosphate acyltransferase [candidate division WOR-3 bacterium]|nr:1-acyl-sn-glycerol-3-phosphate acyltransferase [candidate division WOR-3 bacterium]
MKWRWRLGQIIAYPLAKILFGLKVIGQEYLIRNQAQILVANHRSHLDPFVIAVASKQEIYFMAKKELFQISRFFSWLIKFWNAIPISRQEEFAHSTLKIISGLLQKHKTILVFPEGTRNKSLSFNQLLPFKLGASYLSIVNQVPIVPVAVKGVREIWQGRLSALIDKDIARIKKVQKNNKCQRIVVQFGKPIFPSGYTKSKYDYESLTQKIKQSIEELLVK